MKSKAIQDICDKYAEENFGWNGDNNSCRICNAQVNLDVFAKDPIGLKEWYISDMCDVCQKEIYG